VLRVAVLAITPSRRGAQFVGRGPSVPQCRAAVSIVTGHQQPYPRVRRPGWESNPVRTPSQKDAVIPTQGASENRLRNRDIDWYPVSSQKDAVVRRGLRAPSARQSASSARGEFAGSGRKEVFASAVFWPKESWLFTPPGPS